MKNKLHKSFATIVLIALTAVVLCLPDSARAGSIVAWGSDIDGKVNDTPTGSDFTAIAAGGTHSLALRADGSIASWGLDDYSVVSDTPTGSGFIAIAAGGYHSLALRADGSIVSWGYDVYGEVSDTPTESGFTAIAAGHHHSLALRADGSIVSWGYDAYRVVRNTPTESGFTAIAAGGYHSLALRADGSIVSWDYDDNSVISNTPTETGFTAIAAGFQHSLALRADGSIASWGGYSSYNQVSDTPAGSGFTAIAERWKHCLALRADGSIVAWGYDNNGQVTDTPTESGFIAIAAGNNHNLALTPELPAPPVVMEWVTVGDLGNGGELSGNGVGGEGPDRICGAVDYVYQIGKYEVTAGQYAEFLNAVAAIDTYGLYGSHMGGGDAGGPGSKIVRNGTPGNYTYSVAADWANRPVNNVSFWAALRFANWMHNGQGSGDTETGAYDLTAESIANNSVMRNAHAVIFIPTEDEWYKAAYYKGGDPNAGYWDYPAGTDSTPSNDLVDPDPGNNMNFHDGVDYTIGDPYWRTEVGDFENSESPYGTFDQGGNVWEWNETIVNSSFRVVRGGSYNSGIHRLHANARTYDPVPTYYRSNIGFRVAKVPEPTAAPVADADGPYSIYVGDTLMLDAGGSTDDDNDIVSYMWDLDDDENFETDAGGQAVFEVSYAYLQSLSLLVDHTYNIHLQVTDSEGQSDIADSTLVILPQPATVVAVDIKPGSCPNPLNVKSRGVLPLAILGSQDLDVTTIVATSVRLVGVEPLRNSLEDVAAPASDANDCNCTEAGPDGFLDLTLKFETQKIVDALGDVNHGDVRVLALTGVLFDPMPFETPIEGADCIVIRGRHKPINAADINKNGVVDAADFAILAENWLETSIVEE